LDEKNKYETNSRLQDPNRKIFLTFCHSSDVRHKQRRRHQNADGIGVQGFEGYPIQDAFESGRKDVVRGRIFAIVVSMLLLLVAAPACAAPTCQDRNGGTIRCGTEGAMPVGWTLPDSERAALALSRPAHSDTREMLQAICVVGLLLALFALMPEFDGTRAESWGRQEDDEHD
jgi:hypothetical protein